MFYSMLISRKWRYLEFDAWKLPCVLVCSVDWIYNSKSFSKCITIILLFVSRIIIVHCLVLKTIYKAIRFSNVLHKEWRSVAFIQYINLFVTMSKRNDFLTIKFLVQSHKYCTLHSAKKICFNRWYSLHFRTEYRHFW